MAWKCKECGKSYFEDCSPYYTICLNCGNEGNYIEEMADVVIVLHMAKEIYNISESELDKVINKKMEKNLNRIGIYRNPTTL